MHLLLLLAGLLSIVIGGGALAYGAVDPAVRASGALTPAASVAVVGGFILLGLSSVLSRLQEIVQALEAQAMARPTVMAEARPVLPPLTPFQSASAPFQPPPRPKDEPPAPQPAAVSAVVPPPSPPEPRPEPGRRPEPVLRLPAAPEWPRVDVSDRVSVPERPPLPAAPDPQPPADEAPDRPSVLKSGVIEGMAYTLYSNGSVDAELPEGTRHFASIAEWRAHLRERA